MKTNRLHSLLGAALLLGFVPLLPGQGFSSGSDGSYGPLEITTTTTLDLPPDGIFNCTTISVAANQTLSFNRNARNTPVYLLATGDVEISGIIRVSGERGQPLRGGLGGPGGYDGGAPLQGGLPGGSGLGPGGGLPRALGIDPSAEFNLRAGPAAYNAFLAFGGFLENENRGSSYGSPLLLPLVGGSGGGGGTGGGGGGGGALLIASNTRINVLNGSIVESLGGGQGSGEDLNTGSGGAIRLVAPVVGGTGQITVAGGVIVGGRTGGYGRIRIDTLDRTGLAFLLRPGNYASSVGSLMVARSDTALEVIEAAGTVLDPQEAPSLITLPVGSDPNQTVKVRTRNFGQVVPITVALVPTNGDAVTYDAVIDNSAANPAETTVDVTFPINTATTVQVWTRDP